jgi:hypothetical protein
MPKAKKDAEVYEVPTLVITPEKAPVVSGNYEAIETVLKKWDAKVSAMKLTGDNMDEVSSIKKAAVAVRNQLDAKVDAAKKMLFNDPKKIFEARMKSLYSLVANVEGAADKVLDKLEQERVDGINEVLDHYKAGFQEKYGLEDTFLVRVEYRKNYYNKGMEEKTRKDDLEQQFKDLKKEQEAYASSVRLIISTCKDEPRINPQFWIKMLDTYDVASIVEEINAEKERLREQDTQQTRTASSTGGTEDTEAEEEESGSDEATKEAVLGLPRALDFKTDFSGRMKTITGVKITYPCDLGDTLKALFTGLEEYGIKVRQPKQEVAF